MPAKTATVKVRRTNQRARIPTRATEHSAGWDLYALDTGYVHTGQTAMVHTGIAVAIPRGFEGQIRPRSGLALKNGVTVVNAPGTIDSDYRGEVCVILITHHRLWSWREGERIAQLVIQRVPPVKLEVVEDLDETERGAGGFGSTGK